MKLVDLWNWRERDCKEESFWSPWPKYSIPSSVNEVDLPEKFRDIDCKLVHVWNPSLKWFKLLSVIPQQLLKLESLLRLNCFTVRSWEIFSVMKKVSGRLASSNSVHCLWHRNYSIFEGPNMSPNNYPWKLRDICCKRESFWMPWLK